MTLNTAIDYTEMGKLVNLLTDNNIPFEMGYCYDGLQLFYPSTAHRVCDAICNSGSYGHEVGLLEIMGLVDDNIDDDVQFLLDLLKKAKVNTKVIDNGDEIIKIFTALFEKE